MPQELREPPEAAAARLRHLLMETFASDSEYQLRVSNLLVPAIQAIPERSGELGQEDARNAAITAFDADVTATIRDWMRVVTPEGDVPPWALGEVHQHIMQASRERGQTPRYHWFLTSTNEGYEPLPWFELAMSPSELRFRTSFFAPDAPDCEQSLTVLARGVNRAAFGELRANAHRVVDEAIEMMQAEMLQRTVALPKTRPSTADADQETARALVELLLHHRPVLDQQGPGQRRRLKAFADRIGIDLPNNYS